MSGREHSFIGRLSRRLSSASQDLIGDDAALVSVNGAALLVAVDVLVEGVDFRLGLGEPADLGWKALAVNVSDVAAMGGTPVSAVVALVLGEHGEAFWEGVYDGLAAAADAYEVTVAGGDVSSGPAAAISVTMLGEPAARVVWRSGAQPGDMVFVSGPLGGAAAGLAALEGRRPRDPSLETAFLRPRPSVARAGEAVRAGATAMIDVSDGLSTDALHIARASNVGLVIEVDRIPLAEGVTDSSLALSGGEDFVLCFTLAPSAPAPAWAVPVGECLPPDQGCRLVHADGSSSALEATGWDHLAP